MNRIHIAVLAAALAIIGTVTAAEVRQLQAELASTTAAYQQAEAGRQQLGTALYGLMGAYNERVPRCPEDAVLVGAGDFEQGQWDRYECGPSRDSYTGETP